MDRNMVFEKKKKKQKRKKKYKRSSYTGTNVNGEMWRGRQGIYYPILMPPHIFGPGPFGPKPPDPLDFDYGSDNFTQDYMDGCGMGADMMGEESFSIDEQSISVVTLNDQGKRIKSRNEWFNAERFKRALSDGVVKFLYIKRDNQPRGAYGTTNMQILRQNKVPNIVDTAKKTRNTIRYYDLEKLGWRSFVPDRLKVIYEKVEIPSDENKPN